MARSSKYVQVGKHKLELSNLEKPLYPDDHVLKAEIIQYYLSVGPTLLSHVKGRPLSLVRFPNGIDGEQFFQKNRPDWAPDWIDYVAMGSDAKKDYIMATNEASLVWLANLACLELHQMQVRKPHYINPDYIVYDLDPPEGFNFDDLKEIALSLKDHLESLGYEVFLKTTGGKGLHLLTPVLTQWSYDECFKAAQDAARPFVAKHTNTTLHIKKDARKGRVLIDIYRNRNGQTIVAPYSLRGKPGAPVSMPISWDYLDDLQSSQDFHIANVPAYVIEGDAWEGFAAYAVALHTKRDTVMVNKKALGKNDKHKSPEQLADYSKKRDFTKTPEPKSLFSGGDGTGFTVHRHHASHLHYDLRLEEDGVLKSWAVPKGLPPRPGIKRLAVATEDHPMEYLTFEGEIPKGQYGGGKMWVYANGRYEITKRKKDGGIYFNLNSKQVNAEYRMYPIKEKKEWLLERVNNPQHPWPEKPPEPMLAQSMKQVPTRQDLLYEVKWDGIRALILLDEGEVKIFSRNHKDLTKQFPELTVPEQAFRVTSAIFDAEIVVFDKAGKPDFSKVIHRMQRRSEGDIDRAMKKYPAYAYVFDCLYLDGRSLIQEPLLRRREWMVDSLKKGTSYRVSEVVEEGEELFEAARKMGLEGIMAKDAHARYFPGKRSDAWIKVKIRQTIDVHIIGYSAGKGDRETQFGGLHMAERDGNEWIYRGKVGTGFTDKSMTAFTKKLKKQKEGEKLVDVKVMDESITTWIEPNLVCEVEYSMITKNGTLRDPVFLRLREDLE
ncbi:hypothetical protein E1176_18595 [Fulvivirga sp. RKSG066]|uniref:non-homologous end-joining DNA ligase n=1 Tax=Fulvivirga aurantia TaxID=2529383 RepID=UPI0012BB54DC|nr:non-homologous end-joining DNA ligase [Fulvivirga aurantia]MTI23046.1 hypothetical protein [Fulvivirga aurantia]